MLLQPKEEQEVTRTKNLLANNLEEMQKTLQEKKTKEEQFVLQEMKELQMRDQQGLTDHQEEILMMREQ